MDIELLRERSRIIRGVRTFFDRRGYLEVDTPLLAPDLIPETCLEVFETAYVPPRGSRKNPEKRWLIPSPEIWMKKLIALHRTNMYQICKCFRNTESRGKLHSPEFTMLEYYTMDAAYKDSLAITEELFLHLLAPAGTGPKAPGGKAPGAAAAQGGSLEPPFIRITMEDAFRRWAGFSLYEAAAAGPSALESEGRRLGLDPPPGLDRAALYDLIFIHAVEPALPRNRPVVILDYPAFVPCLAKKGSDPKTMERWELYVNGIELANCYSEETDPGEIRRYFEAESALKEKTGLIRHGIDKKYWQTFCPRKDGTFPRCSGVALGMDRLIMALAGKSSIEGVLSFTV
ncbi:MAG: LysR family transcriptional regulator [Spirochaetaceae bacterium]|jgi:lysyl-tRNA synthetase class 2|nr:LysR family transcriptional regulator [Spirochaetaceae bacterium]